MDIMQLSNTLVGEDLLSTVVNIVGFIVVIEIVASLLILIGKFTRVR